MEDDRPRDVSGRPVIKYQIPLIATVILCVMMLVIYLLGQNTLPPDRRDAVSRALLDDGAVTVVDNATQSNTAAMLPVAGSLR